MWRRLFVGAGLTAGACAALISTLASSPSPLLLWNSSGSVPIGLYRLERPARTIRGDMVAAVAPEPFRQLADRRRYVPAKVPLLKRIAAMSGDHVCTRGKWLLINHRKVALRLRADLSGRILPWWRGCRSLASDEVMLLADHPLSFDSRYFGPVRQGAIVGKATPLWQR